MGPCHTTAHFPLRCAPFRKELVLLTIPSPSLETWGASASQPPCTPQPPPHILVQMSVISEGVETSWQCSPDGCFQLCPPTKADVLEQDEQFQTT